jgi:sugar phosphate isomerase/epimerase
VAGLTPLVPTLDRLGVSLAIENATIPAAILAEALERIASPRVGITLDTVNSLAIPEGTEHVARTLAPHTLCLHIKDFSVDRVWHMMGFTVEGRPAGQGQLNIPWLLDLLRAAGRSPNAILELWPPRQSTVEETVAFEQRWAVESIEFLRRLIPD